MDHLAIGAVRTWDPRHRRSDLDGNAVAVAAVEVVVLQPPSTWPLVPEQDVEGAGDVALPCVVLSEQNKSSMAWEPERYSVRTDRAQVSHAQFLNSRHRRRFAHERAQI